MSSEIEHRLERLAPTPAGHPDIAAAWTTGRRKRNLRRAGVGVLGIALTGAVLAGISLSSEQTDGLPPADRAGALEIVVAQGGGLYVMTPEGEEPTRLNREGDPPLTALSPRWVPGSDEIVFSAYETDDSATESEEGAGSGTDIYKIASTGGRPEKVIDVEDLAFSPLATEGLGAVAYATEGEPSNHFDTNMDVIAEHPDAPGPVATSEADEIPSDWNPDGDRLIYTQRSKGGPTAILVAKIENGAWVTGPLMMDVDVVGAPAWSPDGKHIAFSARAGGHRDIFSFDVDTHRQTRLTSTRQAFGPRWTDDGKAIAFAEPTDGKKMGRVNLMLLDVETGTIQKIAGPVHDFGGFDIRGSVRGPVSSPTPPVKESPAPERAEEPVQADCESDHVRCLALDRPGATVGYGFGSAWLGNVGEGETFGVARIDVDTMDELARIPSEHLGFLIDVAHDEEWMWLLFEAGESEQGTLVKVDPVTSTPVEDFPLGALGDISSPSLAVDDDHVWVSGPEGSVVRIEIDDGKQATFHYGKDLPDYSRDNGPLRLAIGGGLLWLSYGQGPLGVVDPDSGDLIRVDSPALGMNAYDIMVGGGYVGATFQDPSGTAVLRMASIDGDRNLRERIVLPGVAPGKAAAGEGSFWIVMPKMGEMENGLLVEVDIARRAIDRAFTLDIEWFADLSVGGGYVWVTGNSALYRIEI